MSNKTSLSSITAGIFSLMGLKDRLPDNPLILKVLKAMAFIDLTTLMSIIIMMIIFKNNGVNIGGPLVASELYLIMLISVVVSSILIFPLAILMSYFVKDRKYRGLIFHRLGVYSAIGTLMTFLVIPATIPKFIDEHLAGFLGIIMMLENSFFGIMIWASLVLWAHALYKKEA